MKKITVFALCSGSFLLPLSAAVAQGQAQGRGSFGDGPPQGPLDGPPRGGPRNGGPRNGGPRNGGPRNGGPRNGGPREMGEKGALMRDWRGIDHLNEAGHPLSKAQAKRVVALLLPWSKKPTMTQLEAGSLRQKLETLLTSAQKNALDARPRGFGPPPDGPPPDGPPPDGPPPDGPPPEGRPQDGPPFGDGPGGNDPNRRGPNGAGTDGRGPRRGPRPVGPDGPPDGPPDDGPGPSGGGGGGFGGGGFGGGGFGGSRLDPAQRRIVRAWNETVNPFYAPTGKPGWKTLPAAFQSDEARRYRENRATLEAISRRSR